MAMCYTAKDSLRWLLFTKLFNAYVSYSTVVLYVGISCHNISPKNNLIFYFMTSRQYRLGIAKPKNIISSDQPLTLSLMKFII